jgi:hypothetical protein
LQTCQPDERYIVIRRFAPGQSVTRSLLLIVGGLHRCGLFGRAYAGIRHIALSGSSRCPRALRHLRCYRVGGYKDGAPGNS